MENNTNKNSKEMATETGHYKNIANANTFIEHILTFEGDYKPTKESISLKNLRIQYNTGKAYMDEVINSRNSWSKAVDARQLGFRDVRAFSTRIIGILSGTNLSAKDIQTAKSINHKIQATKLIKPKQSDLDEESKDEQKKQYSTSRQSYDSLYENFFSLVDFLAQSQGYDPLSEEFMIASLQNYAKNLLSLTGNMDAAVAKVATARRTRDQFMYAPETGFIDLLLDAKDFIKGLFGARSMQYKTAGKISFRNIRE